jgi:hypothetical protein
MNALTKTLQEKYDSKEKLQRLYMEVFNTSSGQLVLEDLRNRCYAKLPLISDPMDPTSDPIRIAEKDGKRSVVLHIESMLEPLTPADTGAPTS